MLTKFELLTNYEVYPVKYQYQPELRQQHASLAALSSV